MKPQKSTLESSRVLTCSIRLRCGVDFLDVYLSARNWKELQAAVSVIDPTEKLNRRLCKWTAIKPASK